MFIFIVQFESYLEQLIKTVHRFTKNKFDIILKKYHANLIS